MTLLVINDNKHYMAINAEHILRMRVLSAMLMHLNLNFTHAGCVTKISYGVAAMLGTPCAHCNR